MATIRKIKRQTKQNATVLNQTKFFNVELEKLDYLDALRGVAILLVILVHSSFLLQGEKLLSYPVVMNIFNFGPAGVALFFIVSAYTLYRSWEQRKEESYSTVKYFIRRFFRIAPAYFLVLIVVSLLVQHPLGWSNESYISWQNLLAHFTFINFLFRDYANSIIGVESTISIEIFFYLLLPLILIFIKNKKTAIKRLSIFFILALIVSIISFSTIRIAILRHQPDFFSLSPTFFPPVYFPVFIIGLLSYLFVIFYNKEKTSSVYYFIIYLFIFMLYIVFIRPFLLNLEYYIYFPFGLIIDFATIDFILSGIMFTPLLFFMATQSQNFIYQLFCNKITIFMGKISFSLFLVHLPIIFILKQYHDMLNPYFLTFLAISIAIICAYILYVTIEKNGIKLGKSIISKF